jgi:hypothetical protein
MRWNDTVDGIDMAPRAWKKKMGLKPGKNVPVTRAVIPRPGLNQYPHVGSHTQIVDLSLRLLV